MFIHFNAHFWHMTWKFKSVIFSLLLMILAGAVVLSYAESLPFDDALYLAFITGLTIGYGDIVAVTTVGRITSILLGFIGILFTGMVVAIAIRSVTEAWHDEHDTN